MNTLLRAGLAALAMAAVSAAGHAQSPDPKPDAINYNASKSNTGNVTVGEPSGQLAADHDAIDKKPGTEAQFDANTGMAAGRRQHEPVTINKEVDQASPK